MKRERLWPTVIIGWSLAALVLTLISARAIAHLWFPDPDDAMRLLEVRDWLNGQSWWDVSQHRLWHGHFAMHWSRLVDLPIAAFLIVFDPILGTADGTRFALVAVPLITLLLVISLGAELTKRLAGTERAKQAVLLAPLSAAMLYQLRPMRIDHHGWQIVFALLAVVALMAKPTARSGALLGLSLAVLLTISLEGMPIAAMILGITSLAWAYDPQRRAQLLSAVWAMTSAIAALHIATRGPTFFLAACDAISPSWIVALCVVSIGITIATLWPRAPAALRLGLLSITGAASIITLVKLAPGCLGGPFAQLDPLARRFWYDAVLEGLPVWRQTLGWGIVTVGFPIIGIIGGVFAWRASEGVARARWSMMLPLCAGSFFLSLLVARTGATANALALPGGAWALQAMLSRARAIRPSPIRIFATAGSLLVASPGLAASMVLKVSSDSVAASSSSTRPQRAVCDHGHELADLKYLPRSALLAPIDITPDILVRTNHSAMSGGYHRNTAAIHFVLATFMGDPPAARRDVISNHVDYIVGCPGENETEMYKAFAPNGLWARLERGEHFSWLQPVQIPGSPVLVWKVLRS